MKKYNEIEFEVLYAGEIRTAFDASSSIDDSNEGNYFPDVDIQW